MIDVSNNRLFCVVKPKPFVPYLIVHPADEALESLGERNSNNRVPGCQRYVLDFCVVLNSSTILQCSRRPLSLDKSFLCNVNI